MGVSASERFGFGHYSSNVAFKVAQIQKKSPLEVANELVEKLNATSDKCFEKVEAAVPGFINFWLKPEIFQKELAVILKQKDGYGKNNNLKGQKTIVEYTDPNPFKEFHIGHLMSNSIGEALSRIFEWNGAKVKRACYQGDVGMHVAKAIWGIQKMSLKKIDSVAKLAEAYALGAKNYELGAKDEINTINKQIYERSEKETNKIYDTGRKLSLKYFETIYKKLGTKFDYYFFESETGKLGEKLVEDGLKTGVFEKGEGGAVVFKGEKYGLHTRVFINSEGLPTYEAKELGLAEMKYKKYSYDKSIVITGNEVNDYFKVLLKAMELTLPKLAEKTTHLSHGMMRLPTGKMSSRTGDVITAESLIGEVEKLVDAKINPVRNSSPIGPSGALSAGVISNWVKSKKLTENEKKEIKDVVSIGAIKYSILRQAIGGDIIFDLEKSISFEGDSGPYLQYAYTRAKSVLEKAKNVPISKELSILDRIIGKKVKPSLKLAPSEVSELETMLCRFSEVVERAGKEQAPHYIATYLIELARVFNAYYAKFKIVDAKDEYSPYKVALTSAFTQVMKNGLEILGIKVPERM